MMGKLHLDLICQNKYLLNHVDLKIKLRRSRDAFVLVADAANYINKIKEMALYVRKVQLSPAVRMGHVKALETTSYKYPVRRVEVKVDTVPIGNMNYVQDNMFFLGQLPKRLVIACVDSDALNSTIGNNPFDFKHYNINFVALNFDGRHIPAKPLQPNFEKNGYIRSNIWDSTPVPKNCIKTKEIPFREMIMPKETPCFGLISHPTCLKLQYSADKTRQLESGDSCRRNPYSYHQREHVCRI
jgi:hypothetical protein